MAVNALTSFTHQECTWRMIDGVSETTTTHDQFTTEGTHQA